MPILTDRKRMEVKSIRLDEYLLGHIDTLSQHHGQHKAKVMRKAIELGVARLVQQMKDDQRARRRGEEGVELTDVEDSWTAPDPGRWWPK